MSAAPTAVAEPKVWLITGCSSGLGRALALAALARGDRVIATARNAAKLADLEQRGAVAIALDVTSADDVLAKTVADVVALYGRIDILVNNAGYSLEGAVEECSEQEVLEQFNTNVFGIGRTVRAVLPHMRAQKSGVVANIGSMGGWRALPTFGWYTATKFAVAGISQSLRAEVAHLGIDVTCVDLGSFRTSLLSGNKIVAKRSIADLAPGTDPTRQFIAARDGRQPGDPAKAAALLAEVLTNSGRSEGRVLPSRLALGKDAVAAARAVMQNAHAEVDAWSDLVSTTDVDEAVSA